MPLDPRRVLADFLAAADYYDPVDLAPILDRECSARVRRAERQLETLRGIQDGLDAIRLDRRLRELMPPGPVSVRPSRFFSTGSAPNGA